MVRIKENSFFPHIWIMIYVTERTGYLYNKKNKKKITPYLLSSYHVANAGKTPLFFRPLLNKCFMTVFSVLDNVLGSGGSVVDRIKIIFAFME